MALGRGREQPAAELLAQAAGTIDAQHDAAHVVDHLRFVGEATSVMTMTLFESPSNAKSALAGIAFNGSGMCPCLRVHD